MTRNARFTLTCLLLPVLAWALSGERLLDAAFSLPELGPVDDLAISLALALEDLKAPLGLPDAFGALRGLLHTALGV